jgi:uncharacterized membrane protein
MKKLISVLTIFSMLFSLFSVLACADARKYSADVRKNSEEQFEANIVEIMSGYSLNKTTAQNKLDELEVDLVAVPKTITYTGNTKLYPSSYELTIYVTKRHGSNIYYLQWIVKALSTEPYPDDLDYVSMEWDTAYASYYSSSGDSSYSTVAGRRTGVVVFNLEDDRLTSGKQSYGTVRVSKIKSGAMDFGSKFTHTYTKKNQTGTATFSFSPSSEITSNGEYGLGLSYTYSYSVQTTSQERKWTLWEDNTVTIP